MSVDPSPPRLEARRLDAHYGGAAAGYAETLLARLRGAYRDAGLDPDRLSLDDIAAIDQLHVGGRRASRGLATLGGLAPGQRVLDVGCGTGGASRLLAAEYGATALGVDITAGFVAVATWLSAATGEAGRTAFLCADAAALPLAAAGFDVVWCQHALLNMPDPARVLGEWRRVLRPGGRVLLHEVVAGDNPAPLCFPVPWARSAETSHLIDRPALEALLAEAGFRRERLEDVSDAALAWRQKHSRREAGPGDPGRAVAGPTPRLIFGDAFPEMGRNLRDNLADGRVRILAGVWQRD